MPAYIYIKLGLFCHAKPKAVSAYFTSKQVLPFSFAWRYYFVIFCDTQQIASERIHIERAINKVKDFHIFDRPTIFGTVNQMRTVCRLLTPFQNLIISA